MKNIAIYTCFTTLFFSFNAPAENCKSKPYNLETPEGYNHSKYAPSPTERFYDGKAFIASIDDKGDDDSSLPDGDEQGEYLVQPQWVSVHIKRYLDDAGQGTYAPGWTRPTWYKVDLFDEERGAMDSSKRIDDSYKGVGRTWNRGHLAQRADANRLGEEYGCNTHMFTNAFPQHAKFNQGIWLGLENYIGGLSNQVGELWVIAGPVFTVEPKLIGDAGEVPVAVPDMAFKVVIWEKTEGIETLAFLFPNNYEDTAYLKGNCSSDKEYDYSNYYSSLAEIEDLTGLKFLEGKSESYKQKKTHTMPYVKKEYRVGYCI